MNIIITGGRGLLGSTITPIITKKYQKTMTLGIKSPADIQCDLTKRSQTDATLTEYKPEVIINLAAQTNVDACELNCQNAYSLNVLAVENCVRYIEKNKNTFLIQISSDMVYDGPGPHTENNPMPSNMYSLTKYAGELACRGINCCILRTNFFGNSKTSNRKSFSDWIIDTSREQKMANLFTNVFFSPLRMETIGNILCTVIEYSLQGTYNLSSREGLSKRDFAHSVLDTFKLPKTNFVDSTLEEGALKAKRPFDMRMDPSRLEKALSLTMPTLEEEISKLKE